MAARLIPVTGRPAVSFDSASYLAGVSAKRPIVVPLVYTLLAHDLRLILLVQGAAGAAAFLFLAWACYGFVGGGPGGRVAAGGALVVGLCDMVSKWDTAILSESLALSLTAVLLGCVLVLVRRPSQRWAVAVVGVALVWALARDTDALVLFAAAWLAWFWRQPSVRPKLLAGALAGVAALSFVLAAGSSRTAGSFYSEIAVRVLENPGRASFFVASGMPPTVLPLKGAFSDDANPHDTLRTSPVLTSFRRWAAVDGKVVYAQYMLRHPGWAFITPLRFPDTLGGAVVNPPLSSYGSDDYRPLLPVELQRIVFEDRPAALLVEVLMVLFGFGLAVRVRGIASLPTWEVPVAVGVLSVGGALLAWHGAPLEVGRHAVVWVAALRVAMLVVAAQAVSALWGAPEGAAAPAGP